MTDVHPLTSTQVTPTESAPSPSGLGWPVVVAAEVSIEVSRETSMVTADLGWPE